MRGRQWTDRQLEKSAGEYLSAIVRFGRVLAVIVVGYVAWAGAIGDAFPPDARAIAKAKEHWKSVAFVAFATLYGTVSIDWIIRWLRPNTPGRRAAVYLDMGVQDIYAGTKGPRSGHDMRRGIEEVLIAAQYAVEEALGVSTDEIQLNLIWMKDPQTIQVVARSKPGICPVDYKWATDLMACHAMETNQTSVKTDVRKVQGFAHKPYDAVAAIPIAHADHAFGAVTIDSKSSGTLAGREVVLDRVVRPYAAILMLTRDKSGPSHLCPQRTVR